MSFYHDRIENLNIGQSIANCRDMIESIEDQPDIENNPVVLEHLERMKEVLNITESNINSADVYLTPYEVFKNMNDQFKQIHSQLNVYKGNNNISHMNNAANQSDTLLKQIHLLSVPRSTADLEHLRDNIQSVRRSISQHRGIVVEDGEVVQNLKNQLEEEVSELVDSVKSHEREIENTKEFFGREYKAQLEQQESAFEGDKEVILGRQEESYKERIEELVGEFGQYIKQKSDDLNKKQEQLNELFGFVTDASISGEFHKAARSENKAWITWSVVTVLAFVGLLVYSGIAFIAGEVTNWVDIAKRISLTIGLAGFVTYAAKQAADHKREARSNRSVQMKIQSINPYLTDFDKQTDQVKEIKRQLAEHLFTQEAQHQKNQEVNPNTGNNLDNTSISLQTLISTIVQEVNKSK